MGKHNNKTPQTRGNFQEWLESKVERMRAMRFARGNLRLRLGLFDTEAEYRRKKENHRALLREISKRLYPEKYSLPGARD